MFNPIGRVFNLFGIHDFTTVPVDSEFVTQIVVPTKKMQNSIVKNSKNNFINWKVIAVMSSFSTYNSDQIQVTGKTHLEYLIRDNDIIFTKIEVRDEASKDLLIESLAFFNHSSKIPNKYYMIVKARPLHEAQYVFKKGLEFYEFMRKFVSNEMAD